MNVDQIIFDLKLNEIESIVLRLSYFFYTYTHKVLPNYSHIKFSFKKDPRETILFKYCYKLYQETKDKIPVNEYELYIKAQIDIIKHVMKEKNIEVFIEPHCLCGEKAWKRWLVWKKHYDICLQAQNAESAGTRVHSYDMVINDLKRTKSFLENKLGKLDKEKIQKVTKNRTMFRWYRLGLISGYYLVLSPIVGNSGIQIDFDRVTYEGGITEKTINFFKDEFSYES